MKNGFRKRWRVNLYATLERNHNEVRMVTAQFGQLHPLKMIFLGMVSYFYLPTPEFGFC